MFFYTKEQPDKITENLYLSSMYPTSDKKLLQKLGITHILAAGKFLKLYHPDVKIFILNNLII
jgi:hypothetical protein